MSLSGLSSSSLNQHYLTSPLNSTSQNICFPVDTSTDYAVQCIVVVDPDYITKPTADNLESCCLGVSNTSRFEVFDGCGYQCVSNVSQEGGQKPDWWEQCVWTSPALQEAGRNLSMLSPECYARSVAAIAAERGLTFWKVVVGIIFAAAIVLAA